LTSLIIALRAWLAKYTFLRKHLPTKVLPGNANPWQNRQETCFLRIYHQIQQENREFLVAAVRRKSTGQILFAEVGGDFMNFLFSFLSFPLGGVLHMLQGFSSLNCIDNLYKSVTELSPESYLISQHLKEKLVNPPIAAQFGLDNQIIPIGVAYSSRNMMVSIFTH